MKNPVTELRRRVKADGVSKVARELNVSRQHIYDILDGEKPGMKILLAMGFLKEVQP